MFIFWYYSEEIIKYFFTLIDILIFSAIHHFTAKESNECIIFPCEKNLLFLV